MTAADAALLVEQINEQYKTDAHTFYAAPYLDAAGVWSVRVEINGLPRAGFLISHLDEFESVIVASRCYYRHLFRERRPDEQIAATGERPEPLDWTARSLTTELP